MQLDIDGLRRELALRGMTQAELAAAAGVTAATISHCLAGRSVNYLTLRKLARAMTVTPVLAGAQTLVGPQREAATESPLLAAGAGASSNASTE